MDRTLSPEILQRIRVHCDTFCAEHRLDAIREELQDLIEEKTLSYLSVSENLQEEDAFIMARERFEDPEILRERFGPAAAPATMTPLPTTETAPTPPTMTSASMSTGRRLFAAFVASFAVAIVVRALLVPFQVFMTVFRPAPGIQWMSPLIFSAVQLSLMLLALLAFYGVLRRWGRATEAGARPWFVRIPVVPSLLLLLGLVVVERFLPTVVWTVSQGLPFVTQGGRGIYMVCVTVFGLVVGTGRNMVWLWWVDRAPFSNTKVLTALACAFAAAHLISGAFSFLPGLEIVITDSGGVGGVGIELARLSANNLTLYLRPSPPHMLMGAYWSVWGSLLVPQVLAAGLATLAHVKVCRPAMRRNAARARQETGAVAE
ncbi:MAG: hypothetical protein K1Y02_18835 [Candidatus Hydrogenedentes bacterium]|nr:hypothetical protein [Candidatus Hydrogenedentota bacterium]